MKMQITLALLLLMASTLAYSGTWIKDTKIVDVRWYNSDAGFITTADTSNPECSGASLNGNRYLNSSTLGSDKMISLALAAMMADKSVEILVDQCYNNKHSKITGVIVKSQ
ncbi:MAG: hypothetical protein KZQ85_10895 [Candidatus Thiodiazotropha sp. (ex Myrtea sp. 'scaly one' KF741663)]|nr:hypothetical protein [Candidatus Thiodiazotropha sp. (ex Myrtea sp. 'scaly one' KF741663)]